MKLTREQSLKIILKRMLNPTFSGIEAMEHIVGKGNAEDIDLYEMLGCLGVSREEIKSIVRQGV